MTYIVYQTIRGKKYAYEAEGYWDPEKKQARQRRKYLGAVDEETGEIIPKTSERSVATTKAYGHAYLFSKLIEESGLDKKLKSALKDDGASALALAMAKVIDFTSMRLVHHLMEDTAIAEASKASASFTSQNISDILVRLARDQEGMKRFYASLIQYDEEVLIYDITSVGSQSKGINCNRQLNFEQKCQSKINHPHPLRAAGEEDEARNGMGGIAGTASARRIDHCAGQGVRAFTQHCTEVCRRREAAQIRA